MTTSKSFVLAACIIAFGASSGMSYARSATHVRSDKTERSDSLPQIQTDTSNPFAVMRSDAPEAYTHMYHGGPKSND
jgi:hypothetical protein